MEPTGERSDEFPTTVQLLYKGTPQWSRPASGRMRRP